jgi:DNA gyrase subunit A
VYWKKVYELPQASRNARGKPIINLLPLDENERITAVLPVREYEAGLFVFMATRNGIVKKTPLTDYSRPRANGIIAIDLPADDSLIGVDITDGSKDVLLTASNGKAVRFNEANVRAMGRVARGVRGIRMGATDELISLIIVDAGYVLTATEKGFGKRTPIDDYPVHGRGGQGVISIQTSKRNGAVVGARLVNDEDEIMMITNGGTLVRTRVNEISIQGRNTQGVTLIRLDKGERVVGLDRFEALEDEQNSTED